MKKRVWLFRPVSLALLAVLAVMTAATWFVDAGHIFFFAELAVFALACAFALWSERRVYRDIRRTLERVATTLSPTLRDALEQFPMPVLACDDDGNTLWYNRPVKKEMFPSDDFYGRNLTDLFGAGWREACRPAGMDVRVAEKRFTAYGMHPADNIYLLYCIENTELKHKSEEYDASRPSVLLLAIDNFDELTQSARESEKARLLVETEKLLERFINGTNGFLRKLDRDKYIAIVEERHMKKLVESRFLLLDEVRELADPGSTPLTMSIGVGRAAETLAEGERQARQALDMCLGRGGDQVAIRTAGGYEFYGGVGRGVEKKTKVKARIVATALHDLIVAADNVVIMGHRFGDLDSLGASVGLVRACRELGKHAVVATDIAKNLATPLIDRLVAQGCGSYFEDPADVLPMLTKKTLLIIVDTHIVALVESADIYKQCKTVVVVDHHRKMVGHIDNATIFYHEPYASSASEMVAELAQYFSDQTVLGRYEAEALLAGIMLDTKNFVLKTGVRTFEAAAYLRRLGADTVEVRKLFASSMESYQKRARLMERAEIYRRCAIATTDVAGSDMRIVAPQAADEMLGICDVDASFVLYKTVEDVSLSARSMGAINVQVITEKLGGGGHQTMAGAQFKDATLEQVRDMLLVEIDSYYKNKPAPPAAL